jgi:hypothetical protein
VPLLSETSRAFRACPQCNEGWAVEASTGANMESIIPAAIKAAKDLFQAMEHREKRDGGFGLSLEVNAIPPEESKSFK